MIDLSILPIFITTVIFLVLSPGPDLLLISSYASTKGVRAGVMIAVGVFIAGIFQTLLVALGLGQLMEAMPAIATVIKLVGAFYLTWLGANMLRCWFQNKPANTELKGESTSASLALMMKGLLNNMLNPKAIVFFSLFLPQFVETGAAATSQIIFLGVLLSTIALLCNILVALVFCRIGRSLGETFTLGRHVNAVLGIIFMGLAARLAAGK